MIRAQSAGFTLIEVVVALFFIAVGVIATAPLFVYAAQENAGGGDMGLIGAAAVRQLETMRATNYAALADGGSLTANTTGYFDDSDAAVVVRWTIAANPNPPGSTKVVTVRATAVGSTFGGQRSVTLVTIRGDG